VEKQADTPLPGVETATERVVPRCDGKNRYSRPRKAEWRGTEEEVVRLKIKVKRMLQGTRHGSMPQISLAYCRMVRSELNFPDEAVFKTEDSNQRDSSLYASSTAC